MFHYSIIRLKSKAGLSRDFKAGKICVTNKLHFDFSLGHRRPIQTGGCGSHWLAPANQIDENYFGHR
jgi:hypothetical protein